MPEPLRTVLRADPARDDWAGFSAAMAFADAGIRVLPCEPGSKGPITWGSFQRGAKSASDDREVVRDAFVANPGANVGIAPDASFVVLDIDPRNSGTLERAVSLGLPVNGYRERSGSGGWHIPLVMPTGAHAERSAIIAPGIEIKAHGGYAVSPHSRLDAGGWYHVEPGRDEWIWPTIPASWPFLDRLKRSETAKIVTTGATEQERRLARRVLHDLAHGRFGPQVRLLLAGDWRQVRNDGGTQRYPSQSEADLGLLAMAVFGAAGNPRVMDCMMRQTRLYRPKWDEVHFAGGQTYGEHSIARALAASPWTNRTIGAAHDTVAGLIDAGTDLLAGLEPGAAENPAPTTVFMMLQFGLSGCRNRAVSPLLGFLLGVQESGVDSPFARSENWVRVPVLELADHLDLDRTTVFRALEKLASVGLIERQTVVSRVNGSPRKDSLVRIIPGQEAAL